MSQDILNKVKSAVVDKTKDIHAEELVRIVIKQPVVKINREKFLEKEFIKYCSENVVKEAIEKNINMDY